MSKQQFAAPTATLNITKPCLTDQCATAYHTNLARCQASTAEYLWPNMRTYKTKNSRDTRLRNCARLGHGRGRGTHQEQRLYANLTASDSSPFCHCHCSLSPPCADYRGQKESKGDERGRHCPRLGDVPDGFLQTSATARCCAAGLLLLGTPMRRDVESAADQVPR